MFAPPRRKRRYGWWLVAIAIAVVGLALLTGGAADRETRQLAEIGPIPKWTIAVTQRRQGQFTSGSAAPDPTRIRPGSPFANSKLHQGRTLRHLQ